MGLEAGTSCKRCLKVVVNHGGVFCGWVDVNDVFVGCSAAVCWRCMRRAPKEALGELRITKTEVASVGDTAWWMHDFCMRPQDKTDFDKQVRPLSQNSAE